MDEERLSPSEQELRAFLNAGNSIDDLKPLSSSQVAVNGAAVTITVQRNDGRLDLEVAGLGMFPNLQAPFARAVGLRALEISPSSIQVELVQLQNFLKFLSDRKLLSLSLQDFSNSLVEGYRDWLNARRTKASEGKVSSRQSPELRMSRASVRRPGGTPLSKTYKSHCMNVLLRFVRKLRLDEDYCALLPDELDLFRTQDWKTPGRSVPTKILTRPELKLLVRLCREEVSETTAKLNAAWDIIDGRQPTKEENIEPEAVRELAALVKLTDGLPFGGKDSMRRIPAACPGGERRKWLFDRHSFPRLWQMPAKEYAALLEVAYPRPRQIFPFLLLFAVYFRYNPSVLAKARRTDFSEQDSAHGMRIAGRPFKDRAGRQQFASWPATDAAHNPKRMLDTIERWTASIRKHAPAKERKDLFLYRNQTNDVRSFRVEHAISGALSLFLRDKEDKFPKRFPFRSLRPTVIDLVHHLFDGDVVMAQTAGNHRKVDTTIEHYLYDGARKRNDESLVPALHGMGNWAATKGVLDPRTDRYEAGGAATPGWNCRDPYNGSMIAESGTVPCRAYGRCVMCENGEVNLLSPTSYAFNVKFRDAILRARSAIPEHAWLARWAPALDELEPILLAFPEDVRRKANLDIPDLPTVE